MKRIVLAALIALGFSTSAFAETLLCVDKQHKPHYVEFVNHNVNVVYVDGLQYDYTSETKDGKIILFSDSKHYIAFLVDPENRDWFFVTKSTKETKTQKSVQQFYALCDNVNLVQEEKEPQLVLNK